MTKIEFGIFDHLDRRLDVKLGQTYDDRLRLIEAYDDAGFHVYHLAEHHATPITMAPSPSVFLAAVAQRTKRIRFGPMVYVLPLHHPLRLVEEICMLDHLSHGRLDIGMGRGISPHELEFFGVSWDDSREIYDEALAIIMQGLDADLLSFEGKYFNFKNVPIPLSPVQKTHPPIWTGIGTPDGAARAGVRGHHVLTNSPLPDAAEYMKRFYDAWGEEHGSSGAPRPLAGVCRHTCIAETDAEAERLMRDAYATWWLHFSKIFKHFGAQPFVAQFTDDFDETAEKELLIFGTPSRVREKIEEYLAKTGNDYFVPRFAFGSLTIEQSLSALGMFVDEIMPHFQ